jgi:hypothetical protein
MDDEDAAKVAEGLSRTGEWCGRGKSRAAFGGGPGERSGWGVSWMCPVPADRRSGSGQWRRCCCCKRVLLQRHCLLCACTTGLQPGRLLNYVRHVLVVRLPQRLSFMPSGAFSPSRR